MQQLETIPLDVVRIVLRFHPLLITKRLRIATAAAKKAALLHNRSCFEKFEECTVPFDYTAYCDLVRQANLWGRCKDVGSAVLIFLCLINVDGIDLVDGWGYWTQPDETIEDYPDYSIANRDAYESNVTSSEELARLARTRAEAVRAILSRPLSSEANWAKGLVVESRWKNVVHRLRACPALCRLFIAENYDFDHEDDHYDWVVDACFRLNDDMSQRTVKNAMAVSCDAFTDAGDEFLLDVSDLAFASARFFIGCDFDDWFHWNPSSDPHRFST